MRCTLLLLVVLFLFSGCSELGIPGSPGVVDRFEEFEDEPPEECWFGEYDVGSPYDYDSGMDVGIEEGDVGIGEGDGGTDSECGNGVVYCDDGFVPLPVSDGDENPCDKTVCLESLPGECAVEGTCVCKTSCPGRLVDSCTGIEGCTTIDACGQKLSCVE